MLIGICGSICAGKTSVRDYLINKHGFVALAIDRTDSVREVEKSTAELSEFQNRLQNSSASFSDVKSLLEFATTNWQNRYVTTSIYDATTLDSLSQRPFFILVHVDAPISVRYSRFQVRCLNLHLKPPTLESFVERDDHYLFAPTTGLASFSSRAQIKLFNNTTTLDELHKNLDTLDLLDERRFRPTWDQYFMTLASLAARRSNCMRRQVGCVLVRAARVISTGYNGTPRNVRNCNEGGCPRCNSTNGTIAGGAALSTCLCIHAEENALLEAGRDRVGGGAVLYCNTCPCLTCTIKIVQVGIQEVVYSRSYYMDDAAAQIFKEANVKLRQFSPPAEGVFNLCDQDSIEPDAGFTNHVMQNGQ